MFLLLPPLSSCVVSNLCSFKSLIVLKTSVVLCNQGLAQAFVQLRRLPVTPH